jgi:hypothetical protein
VLTKRDMTVALNTKAFYIARGAVVNTHRPEAVQVKAELLALIRDTNSKGLAGKLKKVTRFMGSGKSYLAPLVALLINARRGKAGQKGLQGADMAKAVKSFIGRSLRSIAAIASGFLPAVKKFEPLAEKIGSAPRRDKDAKQYGQAKGRGIPADPSQWVQMAVIENSASFKGDKKGALEKYAGAGLERAFADEVKSMAKYIEDKMQRTADTVNAK